MVETPTETRALINEYEKRTQEATDRARDSNDINEGLKPSDVSFLDAPSVETMINPQALREYNQQLNQQTPSWLNVYYEVKGKENPQAILKTRIDEPKLGDALMRRDHLVSFPDVRSGAVYQPELGVWRLFKDSEAITYIESQLTRTLNPWGVYGDGIVLRVRRYVLRMMFQPNSTGNPFDTTAPNLVAFKNGTYNMNTGQLEKSQPENYLINGHDYNLDTSGKATPETDALMQAMMGDAAMFMKEFIGYGFYHSYQPFPKIVFIYGSGGEGKSTLLSGLIGNYLIGRNNSSAVPPDELTGSQGRFKPAQLYGKEMNIVPDIPKNYLANTAILKKLSGEDTLEAEFKGMQGFTFTNYAKMIFSANELPSFTDASNGMKERLVLIPFINGDTRTVNKDFWKQHDMTKVKTERSAFVYQCIQLFMQAKERGAMSETHQMQVDRNEWMDLNDHFGQFIEEACEIDKSADEGESTKNVVAEYKAFCIENNYLDKTTSQTITENLKKYGVVRAKGIRGYTDHNNIWRFRGLKLVKSYLKPAI